MLLESPPPTSAVAESQEQAPVDSLAMRSKILALQADMLAINQQVDCPLRHTFAPGVYAREMLIPAGTLIIGKIHKHAHVNIISQGSASVMTEFGPMHVQAPTTFVSQPGTKRVVLALEDVIWTTIHPTTETDLAKIEAEVIATSYDDLNQLEMSAQPQIGESK